LAEEVDSKALERALERLRRERGLVETPTLAEFVEVSLGQHGGEPETVDKLRWLLAKGVPSPRSTLYRRSAVRSSSRLRTAITSTEPAQETLNLSPKPVPKKVI
jgi:hypothetical protein